MRRTAKIRLTVVLVAVGLLAVAIWTESRTTAVYAQADVERARAMTETQRLVQAYDRETSMVAGALTHTTWCAVAIAVLAFTGVVMLWLPRPRPNDAPADPGPASSAAPAAAGESGTPPSHPSGQAQQPI